MKPSRKTPASDSTPSQDAGNGRSAARKGLQPPPTGAGRGSPAAPVMKQFQKTKAESSGRS